MSILRWVYRSNPLYLVSAALVLFGLRALFPSESSPAYGWALMGFLAGYTTLLAATAWLVVRLGEVWDDARTILLTVVLLLLALSISFDEKLIGDPWLGTGLLLGGYFFSVVLSEALRRALGIRLSWLFRLPYLLLLAVFFLYPLLLSHLLFNSSRSALRWGILGFSAAIALALLTLLPAVRRGASLAERSGTPWSWPWFPWTLFAVLALGAGGRAYSLALSFGDGWGSDSAFAPFFVVPILLAGALLVLEGSLAARSARGELLAFLLALLAPIAAAGGSAPSPARVQFLQSFIEGAGASPFFLTLIAVALLEGYALWRRASFAEPGIVMVLGALSLSEPRGGWISAPGALGPIPLGALTLVLLFLSIKTRSSARLFLAAVAAAAEGWLLLRGRVPEPFAGYLALHALLAATIIIAIAVRDRFARFLQGLAAAVMAVLAIGSLCLRGDLFPDPGTPAVTGYFASMGIAQIACGWLSGNSLFIAALLLSSGVGLFQAASSGIEVLRRISWPRGLEKVLGGLAVFAAALLLSLAKAGTLARPRRWLGNLSKRALHRN